MNVYSEKLAPEIIAKRFPTLEMELCSEISEVGQWIAIAPGESMITDDKYIKSFPLVLDGVLRVYRRDTDGRERNNFV